MVTMTCGLSPPAAGSAPVVRAVLQAPTRPSRSRCGRVRRSRSTLLPDSVSGPPAAVSGCGRRAARHRRRPRRRATPIRLVAASTRLIEQPAGRRFRQPEVNRGRRAVRGGHDRVRHLPEPAARLVANDAARWLSVKLLVTLPMRNERPGRIGRPAARSATPATAVLPAASTCAPGMPMAVRRPSRRSSWCSARRRVRAPRGRGGGRSSGARARSGRLPVGRRSREGGEFSPPPGYRWCAPLPPARPPPTTPPCCWWWRSCSRRPGPASRRCRASGARVVAAVRAGICLVGGDMCRDVDARAPGWSRARCDTREGTGTAVELRRYGSGRR